MSDLERVKSLAASLVLAKEEEDNLAERLKAQKAKRLALEREDLPELMREIGVESIKLDSGEVVEVKDDCDARLAKRAEAFAWLADNNFDGIIKTSVSVDFPRGEHEAAIRFFEKCNAAFGDDATMKEDIHSSTLKAFVKERLAEGDSIPLDAFGVHPYSKATVK